LIETFSLPLREIDERFTSSELVMMAWRSKEQSHYWKKKLKNYDDDEDDVPKKKSSKKKRKQYDGIGPERMPDEFFDDSGDFNLSKVQGEKARQYFERILGISMPMNQVMREVPQDQTSQDIRKAYGLSGSRLPNRR
jgi:hypothetical protein